MHRNFSVKIHYKKILIWLAKINWLHDCRVWTKRMKVGLSLGLAPTMPEKFHGLYLCFTVRPNLHTNLLRKRSFSKTLLKPDEIWKRRLFVFMWAENTLKTRASPIDGDGVTIITWYFCPSFPWPVIVAFLYLSSVVLAENIWFFWLKTPSRSRFIFAGFINEAEIFTKQRHSKRSCAVFKGFISFIICYAIDSRLDTIVASKNIFLNRIFN